MYDARAAKVLEVLGKLVLVLGRKYLGPADSENNPCGTRALEELRLDPAVLYVQDDVVPECVMSTRLGLRLNNMTNEREKNCCKKV